MTYKYPTEEPYLRVEVIKSKKEDLNTYYENTGEIRSSSSANTTGPRNFKRAIIKNSFNHEKYPIGSVWMIGETEGQKINFFGEPIRIIQTRDLYERIE